MSTQYQLQAPHQDFEHEWTGIQILMLRDAAKAFRTNKLDLGSHVLEIVGQPPTTFYLLYSGGSFSKAATRHAGLKGTGALLNREEIGHLAIRSSTFDRLARITVRNLDAVERALEKMHSSLENPIDLNEYRVYLEQDGKRTTITFLARDHKQGSRGDTGTVPGFEVELNSESLLVLRSNFIR